MENHNFKKVNLFILKLLGITTSREDKAFEELLQEKEAYGRLFSSLADPEAYKARQSILQSIDTEKELQYFLAKQRKQKRRFRPIYWQAAAIALLLGGGTAWYLSHHSKEIPATYTQQIHPGTKGAILILGDGSRQSLLNNTASITEKDGSRILNDSTRLNYTQIASTEKTPIINHLVIGRGFEYMLVLQDGTKVWLNSESQLDYPVQFTSGPRKIQLSGEAYFEVAQDTIRPFIVEVNQQFNVKVLGTHFNIKAYPSDDHSETTLIEGKVAVSSQQMPEAVTLAPSQQIILRAGGKNSVQNVNTEYAIAWHNGWFYFNNEKMEKALEQIGRWYNVNFIFTNPDHKEIRVSGKIQRFENLKVILDMLAVTTPCNFVIENKQVHVTTNNRK